MFWTFCGGAAAIFSIARLSFGESVLHRTFALVGEDPDKSFFNLRFWWRDQRISEIVALSPPAAQPSSQNNSVPTAQFPYPFIFLPVPYHTPPIPLSTFLINVIPAARTIREVTVPIPTFDSKGQAGGPVSGNDAGMEVDQGQGSMDEFGRATKGEFVGGSAPSTSGPAPVVATTSARIQTDGILLYVSEASYQPVKQFNILLGFSP